MHSRPLGTDVFGYQAKGGESPERQRSPGRHRVSLHQRADKDKGSVSEAAKRKNLIKMLKGLIQELESEPEKTEIVRLEFECKEKAYKGLVSAIGREVVKWYE